MTNENEVCKYADDASIYAYDFAVDEVKHKLEADASHLVWFVGKHVKLNYAKCHLFSFGSKSPGSSVNIGTFCLERYDKEKLLGIAFDKNLDFKYLVENIFQKNLPRSSCTCTSCKIHGPGKVADHD